MEFSSTIINGVLFLSEKKNSFSNAYVILREKEGRILSDEEIKNLPIPSERNSHASEWKLRMKSTQRIITYLKQKKQELKIVDIGCGNGWFSYHLSSIKNSSVDAVDINDTELEQAARIFSKDGLRFIYADIFESASHFKNKYDIITLNASVQYFNDFDALLSLLKEFLKPTGEIHIIDSPFYTPSQIKAAKQRTASYYASMEASEMSEHYFHHSEEKIKAFDVLYKPYPPIIRKLFKIKDIPFLWLRIKKQKMNESSIHAL